MINRPLKKINFTKEGLNDLIRELEELKEKRPAAVKELSRARELGDLSENGLYTAAKSRLRSMDGRIDRITIMIKLADVVEVSKSMVGIGSRVAVDQNGEKVTYEVVGDFEANPSEKKVSPKSPIGRALLGKKVGEIAQFETPKGITTLKVLETS